jgi:hypothetical protein
MYVIVYPSLDLKHIVGIVHFDVELSLTIK